MLCFLQVAVFAGGVDTTATETKGTVLIHSAEQVRFVTVFLKFQNYDYGFLKDGCVFVIVIVTNFSFYIGFVARELCKDRGS